MEKSAQRLEKISRRWVDKAVERVERLGGTIHMTGMLMVVGVTLTVIVGTNLLGSQLGRPGLLRWFS